MNTYRATSPYGEAIYGSEVVDLDLSAAEERDLLVAGHLEIVPRQYRVLTNRFAAGKQDEVVELALPVEREAMLLGAHIERVDKPAPKKAAKAAEKKD